MSLNRLIFYSAMIGGWAAFAGWFFSELLLFQRSFHGGFWGFLVIMLAAALVGGCIAGCLTLLGGVASGALKGQLHRFLPSFLGGLIGGAVGSMLGNSIFLLIEYKAVQIIGWTIMGLAIGSVEGIIDKSPKKLRNGLIGGGIGGFLGGIIFVLLGGRDMSERATGFVILGMCIGLFIGLAQVILKEAWLTVEAGFRPGRQLVLAVPEIIMGTSEKAALPFIAFGAKGVEPIHLRILRRNDGSYQLLDNNSRTGTFVNGQPVQGAVLLRNNDLIQLGINTVRFRESHKHGAGRGPGSPAAAPIPVGRPSEAIAAGPAPMPRDANAVRPAPARPKPPTPPGGAPRPSPIAAGLPVPKAPPPPPGIAPRPPARPPSNPGTPAVSASAPGVQGCPICGRVGAAVPQSNKRRCASCGILY